MEENIKKAFLKAKYYPEKDLAYSICKKIDKKNRYIANAKLYTVSLFGLVSLAGISPSIKILLSDFIKSGFYEYLSIVFSGNNNIASYWKELSYSIAESLPLTSIVFSFALIFIFFMSFRYVLKQIIKGQLSLSF